MPLNRVAADAVLELESQPAGDFVVNGVASRVRIGANVILPASLMIYRHARNAVIEIGDGCNLTGVIRIVRGDGAAIRIGPRTTFNEVGLSLHEGAQIRIGEDCMFSTEVRMDASDMHPIFDRATGERLNPPEDIEVGDHVWLGTRVLLMKGARIGSGTVVGAGSIVSGVLPDNVLAVGSPARVIRETIAWTRDLDERPKLET